MARLRWRSERGGRRAAARARRRAAPARRHGLRGDRGRCRGRWRRAARPGRQRRHRDRSAARARPARRASPPARGERRRAGRRAAGVPSAASALAGTRRAGGLGRRAKALPFLGPYAASKHALEAIADSLRVELAPWGISVSIVEPASVKTAIWTKGAAQADAMRAGISHDRNELYAERIERFRAVALKRGPVSTPTSSQGPSSVLSRPHVRGRATSSVVTRTFALGSSVFRRGSATGC